MTADDSRTTQREMWPTARKTVLVGHDYYQNPSPDRLKHE